LDANLGDPEHGIEQYVSVLRRGMIQLLKATEIEAKVGVMTVERRKAWRVRA
jgi:hypothetical protein